MEIDKNYNIHLNAEDIKYLKELLDYLMVTYENKGNGLSARAYRLAEDLWEALQN